MKVLKEMGDFIMGHLSKNKLHNRKWITIIHRTGFMLWLESHSVVILTGRVLD